LGEEFATIGWFFRKGLVARRQNLEKSPDGYSALQEEAETAAAEPTTND